MYRQNGALWTGLAQDGEQWRALVNEVMNLPVLLNSGKLSNGYKTCGLSSSVQLHELERERERVLTTILTETDFKINFVRNILLS
jgi:hypothetical protein